MVRLSVMYPAAPGSAFDWDYYLGPHLELARKLLGSRGLIRTEIDRGVRVFRQGRHPLFTRWATCSSTP